MTRHNLPLWLRKKGIVTQKQLVMALLPYLEWVKYRDLAEKYKSIITWQKGEGTLRGYIFNLEKDGLIEKQHKGSPPYPYCLVNDYLWVRRVSKSVPECRWQDLKAAGIYGQKAEKERAAKRAGKKKGKSYNYKHLTIDDVRYIQNNPSNMTYKQLAEMHRISRNGVYKIMKKGYVPPHLRSRPAQ